MSVCGFAVHTQNAVLLYLNKIGGFSPAMPILAIALLLTSAVLHALWNLILKQSQEKYAAMGWQVIISGVLSFFILFFTGLPPRSMWLFAVISMTLEAIYFVLLSFAYSDHDFSLVYPVARGAAPALVVLWSFLFLHEIPSTGGFIGIATIICGLVIIGATSFFQPHEGKAAIQRNSHCAFDRPGHLHLHPGRWFCGQTRSGSALWPEYVHPGAGFDHSSTRAPVMDGSTLSKPGTGNRPALSWSVFWGSLLICLLYLPTRWPL